VKQLKWREVHHSILRSLNPHHVAHAEPSVDAQKVGLVNDGDLWGWRARVHMSSTFPSRSVGAGQARA